MGPRDEMSVKEVPSTLRETQSASGDPGEGQGRDP